MAQGVSSPLILLNKFQMTNHLMMPASLQSQVTGSRTQMISVLSSHMFLLNLFLVISLCHLPLSPVCM